MHTVQSSQSSSQTLYISILLLAGYSEDGGAQKGEVIPEHEFAEGPVCLDDENEFPPVGNQSNWPNPCLFQAGEVNKNIPVLWHAHPFYMYPCWPRVKSCQNVTSWCFLILRPHFLLGNLKAKHTKSSKRLKKHIHDPWSYFIRFQDYVSHSCILTVLNLFF